MLHSTYRPLCAVALPFAGRQHYMHGFDLAAPSVPEGFEDYLPSVIALCDEAEAYEGKAFLTIDEKIIPAGESQRRPGPHVDGMFLEHMNYWGGGGGWNHGCNAIPFARMPVIVASDVSLCRAWRGEFDAQPTVDHPEIPDGDLSHISDLLGEGELLPAGVGYLLSPDCVHESLPVNEDTQRSFMRIALPPSYWN